MTKPKRYRHMTFKEKARYQRGGVPFRPLYACIKCRAKVEDRDRAGHLERCSPEVLARRFTLLT